MEEYEYLVPANSKKSKLLFGFLLPVDLVIFIVGVVLTFIFVTIFSVQTVSGVIIILIPILTAGALIFPVPNYHNVRTLLLEIYRYFFKYRKRYVWRGWCYRYEQSDDE